MRCLNELVVDALQHTADVLEFLGKLRDPQVFRFCAIPQARGGGGGGSPCCPRCPSAG